MNRALRPLVATTAIFILAYMAAILQFPNMLSTRVIGNLLTDNAFLGIAAVGMTFVIISGGIDLSVGAVIGFTTVLNAILIMWVGLHPFVAFAISLIIAAAFGAVMGAAIHHLKVPRLHRHPCGHVSGARRRLGLVARQHRHQARPLYQHLEKLHPAARRRAADHHRHDHAGGVCRRHPCAHRTRFGSYVYALGGNETSAALMGVPVARTTILIYTLSSTLAGLAGIVFSLYTSAGYSLSALGVELDAIAAVVIGGTSLTGGYGFVAGTFIGVMLQGLVQTYIVFDGTLSSWWTKIVIGALLFMFILLQRLVFSASTPTRKVFWKT